MPRSSTRRRKRRFHGNRFTSLSTCFDPNNSQLSGGPSHNDPSIPGSVDEVASAKKIKLSEPLSSTETGNYYVLIDISVLHSIIQTVAKCPYCESSLIMENDLGKKKGFCQFLLLNCSNCAWSTDFQTSTKVKREGTPGPSSYDINLRSVFAFREIGKGFKAMEKFTAFMNMPLGLTKSSYHKIVRELHMAYESVADESMKAAGKEVQNRLSEGAIVKNCQVSLDGTWQKRGHSSLNGVVTAISCMTGKCLDASVMSKVCKSCQHWSERKAHPAYQNWLANHSCQINHAKSSGAMEGVGAIQIFQRSQEKHQLQYTEYVGDGDSSSFIEVEKAKPYGDDVEIKKRECIGHVQKRVGTRCRDLRKSLKGVKLSDGKGISGKGRLTDKAINTLQNYFGMAIRSNSGDVNSMRKAIGAVLFHCSDIQVEHERHKFCPTGSDSWCKWQSDKVTGKTTYKKKINLPSAIKELLQPIFQDLSSAELLSKCLHGLTQNPNESLNNIIWKKCPKGIFVNRTVLEISVSSAIIDFNDGKIGLCKVTENLGLLPGHCMLQQCHSLDIKRIRNSEIKTSEKSKKRRKRLRAIRKGYIDKEKEEEGKDSYNSGSF